MELKEPLGSQASENSRENENLSHSDMNLKADSNLAANTENADASEDVSLSVNGVITLSANTPEASDQRALAVPENLNEMQGINTSFGNGPNSDLAEIPTENYPGGTLLTEDDYSAENFTIIDITGSESEEEAESFSMEAFESPVDVSDKYHKLNRLELVMELEKLVQIEDFQYVRNHIGYLRAAYKKITKEDLNVEPAEGSIHNAENNTAGDQENLPTDQLAHRFNSALDVYKDKKQHFDQILDKQKIENLKEKKQIIDELRILIESDEELKRTYDIFRELKEKWASIGPVPQADKNELWNNFHFLVERFFDKIKINKELKDLDLRKNLEQKTALCEKAEELLLETSIVKTFQKLQKLHEAWREIGPVASEKKDEIWDRFRAATEKLNRRRQEFYEVTRKEQIKNLEAKLALCEKAELLSSTMPESAQEWQKLTDQVNEMFDAWKKIGFAPKKVNNEVWIRFRTALDAIFKNRKEFFLKYKDNQTENYNKKLNLCLQAEALKDSTDWKRTSNELIAMQNEWKKIGAVPSKFSDKIWKRFRTACDEFFRRKSEFFSSIDDAQEENLKRKREIITNLKQYSYTQNNSENLKIINEFQRQYMEIGHVPIKVKDKIQLEYRKTIDDLFDRLGISKKAQSTNTFKTKVESLKNSPNADQALYKERTYIVKRIGELQHEIKVLENNIGFFSASKKADLLKKEFEEKIDKTKQEIHHLEEKLKIIRES